MYYVYAYKIEGIGSSGRAVCVVDMLPELPKHLLRENQYGQYQNNISIEIFKEKGRMFDNYGLISKEEFEKLYGKINYP